VAIHKNPAVFSETFRPPATRRHALTFTRIEWMRLAGLYGVIALLHVSGWGLFVYYSSRHTALVGLGFVAYMFGLRHAFDADHIAAVDDTVRYMLQKASGLWASAFSSRWVIRRSSLLLP
jgi:high-affinity nickel-transport protein